MLAAADERAARCWQPAPPTWPRISRCRAAGARPAARRLRRSAGARAWHGDPPADDGDILEELVGEIEDEFDPDQAELFHEQNGRLWVDGEAPVRALAARLDFELEGHHETTVGGYLSEQLARVPSLGEVIESHGHRFEILAVEETRITEVAVLGRTDPEDEQGS
jgi:Transporter associated domain